MRTTVARVRAIAPHLEDVDADVIEMHIDDAALELEGRDIPEDWEERLQRYLAAHFATLSRPENGNVTTITERVDVLSRTRQLGGNLNWEDLRSTRYGQEAWRMLRRLAGPTLVVTN